MLLHLHGAVLTDIFPFVCYDGTSAPGADFTAAPRSVAVGGSVNFSDISNGRVTSRSWTFEGGTPSTSTDENPVVTYSSAGSFPVSLTVSNENGSNTKTVAGYINVYAPNFSLDFEACADFQVDNFYPWTTYDGDASGTYGIQDVDYENSGYTGSFIAFNASATDPALGTAWSAHGGNRCGMCFASTTPPNNDYLMTPAITLCSNATFSFWAKAISSSYTEKFNVLLSTTDNNPSSFTTKLSGNTAVSATTTWTEYSYNLSAYSGQTVYLAIQCVSNDAFAFMIDDIVITGDCNSAPDADFIADNTSVVRGETVSFTDILTRCQNLKERKCK